MSVVVVKGSVCNEKNCIMNVSEVHCTRRMLEFNWNGDFCQQRWREMGDHVIWFRERLRVQVKNHEHSPSESRENAGVLLQR